MHASQHITRLLVLIFLHQNLSILRVFILKIKDVEGSATFVCTTTLCLNLFYLNLLLVSSTLFIHKLPTFHIAIVLFDSIRKKYLEKVLLI